MVQILSKDGSSSFLKTTITHTQNPTNGSWWMVQILSKPTAAFYPESHQQQLVDYFRSFLKQQPPLPKIPPTAVGGYFRSSLQNEDQKNTPTSCVH
jgi:hypothetical protein